MNIEKYITDNINKYINPRKFNVVVSHKNPSGIFTVLIVWLSGVIFGFGLTYIF